jgi:hypothetical protein
MTMLRNCWFTVALALFAAGGCDDNAPPRDLKSCWGPGCAIVTTSHYNPDYSGLGTINAVQMAQSKIVRDLDSSLDPDVAVDLSSDKLYVLNRTSGSLRRYDLATIAVEEEIATGAADAPNTTSSPYAFWRSDRSTKIYVTLAGNDGAHALGVVDEAAPNAGVTKFIDVPADPADADGHPELSSLYACDGMLYALSQSYTYAGSDVSYAAGRIAVIDLASDSFSGFIPLAGKNPGAIVQEADDCHHVLVATSSDLTSLPDGSGGLERVDLAARASQGFRAVDTDLQGRPFSLTRVSSTLMYVGMYFDPQPDATGKIVLGSAKVIAWNPTTATTLGDATGKAGFISFVELGTDHQLYVGAGSFGGAPDPTALAVGLYVGKADGSLIGTTPIDLGDTPSAIAFQK